MVELGCESGRSWKKGLPHAVPFGRGKLAEVSADDPLFFGEFKVHLRTSSIESSRAAIYRVAEDPI